MFKQQVVEKAVFLGLVKNIQLHGRAKSSGNEAYIPVGRNDTPFILPCQGGTQGVA